MKSYKTLYKMCDKSGVFKGYLLGSLHMHMSPPEFEQLKTKLDPIVGAVDKIFLECPLPHFSALPYGVERAILNSVDEQGKDYQLRYFESLAFQLAMVNGCFWFGTRIVPMPWFKYETLTKHPQLWLSVSKLAAVFVKIYNKFYNIFTSNKHTFALQAFAKEQHESLLKMTKAYANGDAFELSSADRDLFMIGQRDRVIAAKIEENVRSFDEKSDQTALYVVGASHFPGEAGLVELLQKSGLRLEPFTVSDQLPPLNP